jgi:hypothetical protein
MRPDVMNKYAGLHVDTLAAAEAEVHLAHPLGGKASNLAGLLRPGGCRVIQRLPGIGPSWPVIIAEIGDMTPFRTAVSCRAGQG